MYLNRDHIARHTRLAFPCQRALHTGESAARTRPLKFRSKTGSRMWKMQNPPGRSSAPENADRRQNRTVRFGPKRRSNSHLVGYPSGHRSFGRYLRERKTETRKMPRRVPPSPLREQGVTQHAAVSGRQYRRLPAGSRCAWTFVLPQPVKQRLSSGGSYRRFQDSRPRCKKSGSLLKPAMH